MPLLGIENAQLPARALLRRQPADDRPLTATAIRPEGIKCSTCRYAPQRRSRASTRFHPPRAAPRHVRQRDGDAQRGTWLRLRRRGWRLLGDLDLDAEREPADSAPDVFGRVGEFVLDCRSALLEVLPALIVDRDSGARVEEITQLDGV